MLLTFLNNGPTRPRDRFHGLQPFTDILGLPPDHQKVMAFIQQYSLAKEVYEQLTFYGNKALGLGIRHQESVDAVFLYGRNEEGYERYSSPIVEGLTTAGNKALVRRLLGRPKAMESPKHIALLAGTTWDKYRFDPFFLHFNYHRDESIERVTLMPPD